MQYLIEHRKGPWRRSASEADDDHARSKCRSSISFKIYWRGAARREFSTTGGFRPASQQSLLRNKQIGKYIVPIIPDEGPPPFGMEAFFSQYGIYASTGPAL